MPIMTEGSGMKPFNGACKAPYSCRSTAPVFHVKRFGSRRNPRVFDATRGFG